jgi:multiple sugar transport system permease protein
MSISSIQKRGISALKYISILFLVLLWVSPFLWMVMTSFRDPAEPFSSGLFPRHLVITNYAAALKKASLMVAFRNSFFVALMASIVTLLFAIPAGYGFSRYRFKGHSAMMVFLIIMKTLPGVLLALSIFLIVGKIGLYNSHIPLIFINAMLNLPLSIWNIRTIFDGINIEIEEAAMVDGCNHLQAIIRVLLPITTPGMVATLIFVFLLSWNEYLFATTFISSPDKVLVPPVIAGYVGQFAADYTGLITASVMASVPLIIMFILIQRYIIGGLSLGAVKG